MGGSISFLAERDCLTFVANATEGDTRKPQELSLVEGHTS